MSIKRSLNWNYSILSSRNFSRTKWKKQRIILIFYYFFFWKIFLCYYFNKREPSLSYCIIRINSTKSIRTDVLIFIPFINENNIWIYYTIIRIHFDSITLIKRFFAWKPISTLNNQTLEPLIRLFEQTKSFASLTHFISF